MEALPAGASLAWPVAGSLKPFPAPISPRAFRRAAILLALLVAAVTVGALAFGLAALLSINPSSPFESSSDRQRGLENALREVVPPAFTELSREIGGCDPLRGDPDCVGAKFIDFSHTQQERIELVTRQAEQSGWRGGALYTGAGGTGLSFSHGSYTLTASIKSELTTEACTVRSRPPLDCADSFVIERH